MPSMRIASPERRWRAAAAPPIAAAAGWTASSVHMASGAGLHPAGRIAVTGAAAAVGLVVAVLVLRTHLAVTDDGLADHRLFRVVRIRWPDVTSFDVGRPGGLWGGFCVRVIGRDGGTVDLMATRAYSRVPSERHLDELHRISWSLAEAAPMRSDGG